jgi:hypothetical protein
MTKDLARTRLLPFSLESGLMGLIVVSTVKPSPRIIGLLRDIVLGRKCCQCKRKQVKVAKNKATEFSGPTRLGMCGKCHSRYRAIRLPLSDEARIRYDDELIRTGQIVTRETAAAIRDDNCFRQAAKAAKAATRVD